jgi:hypothetical protein
MKSHVLSLSAVLFMMAGPAFADNGLFMVVKGTVKVISGTDKKETAAKVGTKVFSGDTIITEKESRAKIVMADRNVLQLSPESRFEITKYKVGATEDQREAQVALMQGKVRVQVEQKYSEKNKFELRTPTAVAGVRGTQYVAQFEPKSQTTTIIVLTGRVAVSTPKQTTPPIVLTPNMGSTIKEDTTKIEPIRMSAEEIKGMTSETPGSAEKSKDKGADGASTDTKAEAGKERAPASKDPSAPPSPEKSLVTTDIVGGEALTKDTKLQNTMSQPPSATQPMPASVPNMNVPKPPTSNPLVNQVIQNQNTKTKVIVNPRPQQ